mgnify:CR=1 FL=1
MAETNINLIDAGSQQEMEPLTCERSFADIPLAGSTLGELLVQRLAPLGKLGKVMIHPCLWPSDELIANLEDSGSVEIKLEDGTTVLSFKRDDSDVAVSQCELHCSTVIRYPWDLIELNSMIVGELAENKINGTIRENVSIDGFIELGEGSVLLPGVYIEGNAIIGKNCKIGPNCYIRGNTTIGDNCHIGQAVEVKNSLFMDKVSTGHLSYVGDSILCSRTNFGAGTTTANLRHDGKNHKSLVDGDLVDTGRRKLGAIIGDDVHTGINTSIYPGRKLWPHTSTRPGDIVQKDIKNS